VPPTEGGGMEINMEKYIEGNKAAWEEAFDNRDGCNGLMNKNTH
jgi:hypothetical protein